MLAKARTPEEDRREIAKQLNEVLYRPFIEQGGKTLPSSEEQARRLFITQGTTVRVSGLVSVATRSLDVIKTVLKESPEAQEILKRYDLNMPPGVV